MSHFAEIDGNNIVKRVLVVDDGQEYRGADHLAFDLMLGGTWVQCSYNTFYGTHKQNKAPMRHTYPSIGFIYNPIYDIFMKPCDYRTWYIEVTELSGDDVDHAGRRLSSFEWMPPVKVPLDGNVYTYSDEITGWTITANVTAFPNLSAGPTDFRTYYAMTSGFGPEYAGKLYWSTPFLKSPYSYPVS